MEDRSHRIETTMRHLSVNSYTYLSNRKSRTAYDAKKFNRIYSDIARKIGLKQVPHRIAVEQLIIERQKHLPRIVQVYAYNPFNRSPPQRSENSQDLPEIANISPSPYVADRSRLISGVVCNLNENHTRRCLFIAARDIDAVKHQRSNLDFKYRDEGHQLRALSLLILQYELSVRTVRPDGTAGISRITPDELYELVTAGYYQHVGGHSSYDADSAFNTAFSAYDEQYRCLIEESAKLMAEQEGVLLKGPDAVSLASEVDQLLARLQAQHSAGIADTEKKDGVEDSDSELSDIDETIFGEESDAAVATGAHSAFGVRRANDASHQRTSAGSGSAEQFSSPTPTDNLSVQPLYANVFHKVDTDVSNIPPLNDSLGVLSATDSVVNRTIPQGLSPKLIQADMGIHDIREAMQRLFDRQKEALMSLFDEVGLNRTLSGLFFRQATGPLRSLYEAGWGPDWPETSSAVGRSCNPSSLDLVMALVSISLYHAMLKDSSGCVNRVLSSRMTECVESAFSSRVTDRREEVATMFAAEIDCHCFGSEACAAIQPHVQHTLDSYGANAKADLPESFKTTMQPIIKDLGGLVVEVIERLPSDIKLTFDCPSYGTPLDTTTMSFRNRPRDIDASAIAFALFPGLVMCYPSGAVKTAYHAQVVTYTTFNN
ncbi:hypothetical protein BAUCODRAFT_25054 [Baudoinia panamericana UAMH 10762]|uniref:Uncharacterized protein n=1 Tax=Baudoinia panamericana (strain UAMH 10762) TaxID=717646 RepID=M2NAF8_BAUPA|nr:uncharacterized protein BAUCODRAFT_25054 [Baudoinia panamericana UAMH 10762]EMC96114.1 hypothetical protein BAUCODRAFT_25054 [Baudoinia panamericana UAMH 10762]